MREAFSSFAVADILLNFSTDFVNIPLTFSNSSVRTVSDSLFSVSNLLTCWDSARGEDDDRRGGAREVGGGYVGKEKVCVCNR